MIRKFDAKNFKWDGIETLVYKQDGSPFKDVTRQVLYDGAYDIPCQFRYFECLPGDILPWSITIIRIWL